MHRLILWFCGAALATSVGLLATWSGVQSSIEDAGVNIPTTDVLRDYATGLIWAVLLGLSILWWPVSRRHKQWLLAAWLAKVIVAMGVMLPYEEHYSGLDCWGYFRNAHLPLREIPGRLLQGGGELVVGLGAIQVGAGLDSFHALKLTFAMVGFIGLFLLYRSAELLIGRASSLAFWTLMLYPTVLFWSSIYGKDPLVLLAIAVHVWGIVNLSIHQRPRYFVAVLLGVLGASAIRIWMGPILLLPCVLVVLGRIQSLVWRTLTTAVLALALVPLGMATMDRLAIDEASDLFEATRAVTDNFGNSNSALDREVELNSTWDLIAFAPQGLFDTYFRPLPGDVSNAFGLLAGFENLVLLVFAAWAAVRFRIAFLRNPMFFWSLSLLLTWGLAYSLVTYRDLGTAVRFKLQILPVMLGVIGFLIQRRRARGTARDFSPVMRVERAA